MGWIITWSIIGILVSIPVAYVILHTLHVMIIGCNGTVTRLYKMYRDLFSACEGLVEDTVAEQDPKAFQSELGYVLHSMDGHPRLKICLMWKARSVGTAIRLITNQISDLKNSFLTLREAIHDAENSGEEA